MRILIISDSHGNIANLKHVLGFAVASNLDTIIHCGDWNNIEAIKTVIEYKIPLFSVLGNADIDPNVEKLLQDKCKKFERLFLNLEIKGKKIGVIHDIKNLGTEGDKLDIVFFGHWQKQKEILWNGTRAVNPGALENDISFAVYDTDTDKVELINEEI